MKFEMFGSQEIFVISLRELFEGYVSENILNLHLYIDIIFTKLIN